MYGVIFDWFLSLFVGSGVNSLSTMSFDVGGVSLSGIDWICHTATIIVLCVLCFVAFKFVWWLVRIVANGFSLRA